MEGGTPSLMMRYARLWLQATEISVVLQYLRFRLFLRGYAWRETDPQTVDLVALKAKARRPNPVRKRRAF